MQEKLQHLREQIALYQSQLGSQKAETENALLTLQEAGAEMEKIIYDRKQLMVQVKTTLLL